jgi:hypothetical protein
MSEAVEEVSQEKRARYERWRQEHLHTPVLSRLRNSLLRFALASALPAVVVLVGQANGWDRQRLRRNVKKAWEGAAGRVVDVLRGRRGGKKEGGSGSSRQQQQQVALGV